MVFAPFVLFLYGPIITIFVLSFQGPEGGLTFPLRGLSLHWFYKLAEGLGTVTTAVSFLVMGVAVGLAMWMGKRRKKGQASRIICSMRRLLVINPNTTASVSTLLQTHVQAAAGPQVRVRTVTARFGAPYIADEASYAVAAHAMLDAWAAALAEPGPPPDAVLIGCFGDPGLLALRESSAVPITGLAEAAFAEAARHGRFAVVTGGARWKPMLQRLAQALGHGDALAGILTVAPNGIQLAADPAGARALLAQACGEAASMFKVQAVILGGAGLAGMTADIQPLVSVPVIDSVAAGARFALQTSATAPERERAGFDFPWHKLSAELTVLGAPPART